MITGDHKDTAAAIAGELYGTDSRWTALSGMELDRLSDDQLVQTVDQVAVYARVSAEHKLRIIQAWKRRGGIVAMTGDGVNDAPAIKAADIGIAMGITGTDVTKEAADMVVTDDNFASIAAAVEEGRGVFDNIRKTVHFLLSCNLSEVLVMLFAALLGLPLATPADSDSLDESRHGRHPGLGAGGGSQGARSYDASASPAGGSAAGRRTITGDRRRGVDAGVDRVRRVQL